MAPAAAITRRLTALKIILRTPPKIPASCSNDIKIASTCSTSFRSQSTIVSRMTVHPNPSLMDEPVHIRASNIPPNCPVTLQTTLNRTSERLFLESRNFYESSSTGELDLNVAEAVEGSCYIGRDAMGPLWSLKAKKESASKTIRTMDVTTPLQFHARLWKGHEDDDNLLAECSFQRMFMAPNVRRVVVSDKEMYGVLFMPMEIPSGKKLPLIATIYGGVVKRGHLIEERAAIYASRGFASLAVGFFGVGDLPKMYQDLTVEHFERTIDHVTDSFDQIDKDRVGIFGSSKGGDIALSCAAFLKDKIKACVIGNAAICSIVGKTSYKGYVVEALEYDLTKCVFRSDGMRRRQTISVIFFT
jgi:hypothetical protein